MRVDSHQHFWQYNPSDYGWMGTSHRILKQDYLPDHLYPPLRENGLAGSVAVQARSSTAENDYLLGLREKFSFIKGVVGWLDFNQSDLESQLARYQGKLTGIRHAIHDEPDIDYMCSKMFQRGIGLLERHGMTYDLLIRPEHLENSIRLADQFPNQRFVIDHIAKPDIASGILAPWQSGIRQLAQRENVFCKLSGMVTEANFNNWDEEDLPLDDFIPYIDTVIAAFTPSRIMFGTDWPVCTLAATYDEVYDIVNQYILRLSPTEQADIMGETATRFYQLT